MDKLSLKNRSGFTLVELIIVIAVIAVLAAATFVAVDPARRLNQSRNATRFNDATTIASAIQQYIVDNDGALPSAIDPSGTFSEDTYFQIGTAAVGCDMTCSNGAVTPVSAACVDLAADLTSYVPAFPTDPETSDATATNYVVYRDSTTKAFTVHACNAEGEDAGGTGTAPTISVTR